MRDLTTSELEAIADSHRTYAASDVKANWRAIVQEARLGEVIVTNYNRPEAVVISVEHYAQLKAAAEANDPLRRLREDFDGELAVLQTADAAARLRDLFQSTPEEMAAVANGEVSRDE